MDSYMVNLKVNGEDRLLTLVWGKIGYGPHSSKNPELYKLFTTTRAHRKLKKKNMQEKEIFCDIELRIFLLDIAA